MHCDVSAERDDDVLLAAVSGDLRGGLLLRGDRKSVEQAEHAGGAVGQEVGTVGSVRPLGYSALRPAEAGGVFEERRREDPS